MSSQLSEPDIRGNGLSANGARVRVLAADPHPITLWGLQRVLQSDSNNAPALQDLGIVALRRNDVHSAQDYLARALALNPRLPKAKELREALLGAGR